MPISTLGLLVQTIGAGLLAVVFLYLSRGQGNRVLGAAGLAWLFLFLALLSLWFSDRIPVPYDSLLYLYLKILSFVALFIAANQMRNESPLAKPFGLSALVSVPVAGAVVHFSPSGLLFDAIQAALGAIAWFFVVVLVLRGRAAGVGRRLTALMAVLTMVLCSAYALFFGLSATHKDQIYPFLAYNGFYDLFLEMLFGIGLIIWAMEDVEAKLSAIHARARDTTQRSKRRIQLDPLTDTYNRFFLEEIRPILARETGGGSIVLIDVDGLKTINDREGHDEGDKAIWTVAAAIKKLIRADDYLIRWGGDEFLVVLPGMDQEIAKKRFYMLPAKIEEVRQSPRTAGRAYKKFVAASVGVTPFSSRVPFDIAIESADRVMYERKKAHKQLRGDPQERPTPREPGSPTWDKSN